jgi:UDP-glucose 4-epimerase
MHRFKSDMEIPNKLRRKITDVAKVSHINAILLRYFNPIGAHPSLKLENYLWSTSKLSFILRRLGLETNSLFTANYPTTEQRWGLYSRS